MKFLQSSYQIQILTVSCLPREILENIAYIYHTYHCITGTITGFSSSSLFISAIMSSETPIDQAIKALQAQNAQFQEMFLNLAKSQQDLKTLTLKDKKKKKKKKKRVVLLNMGHRFGNNLRQEADRSHSSGGGEN